MPAMGARSAFDDVLASGKVAGSQVSNGVLTVNVAVSVDETGATVEGSTGEPVYGTLGSGGRPLPEDADGFAETISARSADGLPVLDMRDLRIEKARAAPPGEGTIYKAGYYGAELRFDVPSEGVSTFELRDSGTTKIQGDDRGVVVLGPGLTQGSPASAQDVALAQPAIDLLAEMGPIVLLLAAAVNTLAPGTITPTQILNLNTKLAPYLVPGSPNAPTTRAPKIKGTPGP